MPIGYTRLTEGSSLKTFENFKKSSNRHEARGDNDISEKDGTR